MPAPRRVTLHQFDYADHQQDGRPRLAEIDIRHVVQQEKNSNRHQHCGPHELAGTAPLANATRPVIPKQSPVLGEQIHAEHDQYQWPITVQAEVKSGIDEKQHS